MKRCPTHHITTGVNFCTQCGEKLVEIKQTCPKCGAPIVEPEVLRRMRSQSRRSIGGRSVKEMLKKPAAVGVLEGDLMLNEQEHPTTITPQPNPEILKLYFEEGFGVERVATALNIQRSVVIRDIELSGLKLRLPSEAASLHGQQSPA